MLENLTNMIETFTKLTVMIEHNYLSWTNNADNSQFTTERSGYHRNKVKIAMLITSS